MTKTAAWRVAVRPATLLLGITPVVVGTAVAAATEGMHVAAAVAALLGALALQVSANLANDVFDFRKGADTSERLGPPRAVSSGWLSQREVFIGLAVMLIAALAAGLYLASVAGWPLLVLGIVAMVSAVAYTAGPWPLGYHGFGDVFVFAFFGLAAVVGTVYVQTHALEPVAVGLAVPLGLLAAAVLNVNNIRDLDTDTKAGKRTLAVRFGRRGAVGYLIALFLASYVAVGVLVVAGLLTPWSLVVALTAPLAWRLVRTVQARSGRALNPVLGKTVLLQALFGGAIVVGLL